MKTLIVFSVLLSVIFNSSCASPAPKAEPATSLEEQESLENTIEATAPSREALYVYNAQAKTDQGEIVLRLNDEPALVNNSYFRLAGLVAGNRPLALIDISGKGHVLEPGETIGQHRLLNISLDTVTLGKEE